MKNKHNHRGIFLWGTVLFVTLSCGVNTVYDEGSPAELFISAAATKVSGDVSASETHIGTLHAYAFKGGGFIDGEASGTGLSITLQCTTGQRDIFVAANMNPSSPLTISGLSSQGILLEDENPSALKMSQTATAMIRAGGNNLPMVLERYVSKVQVDRMRVSATVGSLASSPLELSSMYLTNVIGCVSLAGAQMGNLWLNKMGYQSQGGEMTHELLDLSIASGASHDVVHHLYLYPNQTEEDTFSRTWEPRHTRLVMEGSVAGTTYYYPVTLPVTGRNTCYRLANVIFGRTGSLHPEDPLSYVSLMFSDPTVGDMGEAEDGTLPFKGRDCSILFAPDGVDPFDYLDELTGVSSGLPVFVFSDGTVSPFAYSDEAAALSGSACVIIFEDGTVSLYKEFPEGLDLSVVSRVIVISGDLESFIERGFGLTVDAAAGAIVLSDGTILPIVKVDESLGLDYAYAVLMPDGTLVPLTVFEEGINMGGTLGVILPDGDIISFSDYLQGLGLSGTVTGLYAFTDSLLAFVPDDVRDITVSAPNGVLILGNGSVVPMGGESAGVVLGGQPLGAVIPEGADLISLLNETLDVQLSYGEAVFILGSGSLESYEGTLSDVLLKYGSMALIVVDSSEVAAFDSFVAEMDSLGWDAPVVTLASTGSLDGLEGDDEEIGF